MGASFAPSKFSDLSDVPAGNGVWVRRAGALIWVDEASFGGGGGAPSGPAGGVLGGTYPNPAFAADMATQAELDALLPDDIAVAFSQWRKSGVKCETILGRLGQWTTYALISGQLVLVALPEPLRAGVTYNSISFFNGFTAGAAMTHQWFCLVKQSDRSVLRSTVDDTNAAWGTVTLKTLALSSSYTPGADTPVWLGVMVSGTTMPALYGAQGLSYLEGALGGPIIGGTSNTGLTTPLADATVVSALSALGINLYGMVA